MTHILIVDDQEEFGEMVEALLEEEGFQVSVAHSPDDAFELVDQHEFDLIICDLVMPMHNDGEADDDSAMVGVHAIHQFHRKCPNVPIVAVSGHLTGAPLKAIASFGARASLSKPFGRDELLSTVKSSLN